MMQAEELSRIMAKNGGKILDQVKPADVKLYGALRKQLMEEHVGQNESLQADMAQAFGLQGKKIAKSWHEVFFQFVEGKKGEETFDFFEAYHALYGPQAKSKPGPVQFALLSRVANLIHPEMPIYEAALGDLMSFKKPTSVSLSSHERLREFMYFYEHLKEVSTQLLDQAAVQDLLKVFKIQHREASLDMPMLKRLDFLLRAAGSLSGKGAMV